MKRGGGAEAPRATIFQVLYVMKAYGSFEEDPYASFFGDGYERRSEVPPAEKSRGHSDTCGARSGAGLRVPFRGLLGHDRARMLRRVRQEGDRRAKPHHLEYPRPARARGDNSRRGALGLRPRHADEPLQLHGLALDAGRFERGRLRGQPLAHSLRGRVLKRRAQRLRLHLRGQSLRDLGRRVRVRAALSAAHPRPVPYSLVFPGRGRARGHSHGLGVDCGDDHHAVLRDGRRPLGGGHLELRRPRPRDVYKRPHHARRRGCRLGLFHSHVVAV